MLTLVRRRHDKNNLKLHECNHVDHPLSFKIKIHVNNLDIFSPSIHYWCRSIKIAPWQVRTGMIVVLWILEIWKQQRIVLSVRLAFFSSCLGRAFDEPDHTSMHNDNKGVTKKEFQLMMEDTAHSQDALLKKVNNSCLASSENEMYPFLMVILEFTALWEHNERNSVSSPKAKKKKKKLLKKLSPWLLQRKWQTIRNCNSQKEKNLVVFFYLPRDNPYFKKIPQSSFFDRISH